MTEALPVVTVSIDGTRKHGRCGSAITDTLNLEGGFPQDWAPGYCLDSDGPDAGGEGCRK